MAKQQGKIYLGYEDETIGDRNQTLLNYTVNKIGGLPDWPPLENLQISTKCPLCGLHRLLVIQCYAPLENSIYHRTLYVFACINPNCWIQSESWLCVRSQCQDNSSKESRTIVTLPTPDTALSWCQGADEWDENDNDTANGNFMNVDNAPSPNNAVQRNSDEDEESNSYELENVEQAFGNLQVFDAHNANMSPIQEIEVCAGDRVVGGGGSDEEPYEEAAPLHGDRLFHAFITRLRNHPGQILRYSREEPPILGAPLPSTASTSVALLPRTPDTPKICQLFVHRAVQDSRCETIMTLWLTVA
ncbi:hypothetical protein SFRURICE_020335 [Spodoptera frugiperda]|nr:hypothetical protein SFRURICE_020335 [Spodoptera frugiperda]